LCLCVFVFLCLCGGGMVVPVLAFLPGAVAATATATGQGTANGFVEGWFPLTQNEQFLLNGTAPLIDTPVEKDNKNDTKRHSKEKKNTTNKNNKNNNNTNNNKNKNNSTTPSSPPTPTQPYCGEIYLRARVTTTTAAKCVSSIVPVVTPINYIPPTEFNIDLLWQWLTLNLNYGVYPVMEGKFIQEAHDWYYSKCNWER
jgi:hypothetical protein